jgi:hypothetical protein
MKRTVSGLLAVVLAVLAAGGCGVRPSGVINGDEAPSGPAMPGASGGAALYFVRGSTVVPVVRAGLGGGSAELLGALQQGPTQAEISEGYSSELPPSLTTVGVGESLVTLSVDVRQLSDNAVNQIVCTLLAAGQNTRETGTVTVSGGGQSLGARSCTA